MEITKVSQSKLGTVDLENTPFGRIFTDHMFLCNYVNGQWETPQILPYQPLTLDPSSSVFHYGQAVFEGMKGYKDEDGKIWLFRPKDNFDRINKSAHRLAIPEFPESYFFEGITKLLELDSEWIKPGKGNALYIRPFVFASQACVQAAPSTEYKFMIICSPVSSYYGGDVNVLIAEKFSRAANGGVGFAKAAGNYASQFHPTNLALEKGYQQIIWTDANTHSFMEEAGTMNIFFKINDTLITAPTNDRILDGITRKSVIKVAKKMNLKVDVRSLSVTELIEVHKNGTLQEIFGTGTAVTILPINGFGYNDKHYPIAKIKNSTAEIIKDNVLNIQYNLAEDPYGWRYQVV